MQDGIVIALAIVAYLAASRAVHGWRDLAMFVPISAMMYVPVKLVSAGSWFGKDALDYVSDAGHTRFSVHATGALMLAFLLGAVAMLVIEPLMAHGRSHRTPEA